MKNFIFSLIIPLIFNFTSTSGQENPYLTLSNSSVTYIYNVNNDSVPYQKTLCEKKQDTIYITKQKYDNNKWLNESQIKYTSDFSSSREYSYKWSGSTWVPESLTTKKFEDDYISKKCNYFYSKTSMDWICNAKTEYFRDIYFGADSVYTYKINDDSTDINLVEKEYRTNCYDKPIQAMHYTYKNGKSWLLSRKTEYMYCENNHDITITYYTYNKEFKPEYKVYSDYDKNGNIIYQQEFNWQSNQKNWRGVNMYIKKLADHSNNEETSYRIEGQDWTENSKTISHLDTNLNILVVENLTWIDSLKNWNTNTKTFNETLTQNTITKNNTAMDEQVYLSDRSIIIENEKYSQSSYSLYSLGGSLLQRGTIAQNHIDIDPKIHEQTLVLILMSHSAIFSKKLHFMQ